MEGMMRQMVMAGPRKSRIIEVPIPRYNDDEMLVKVTLTGYISGFLPSLSHFDRASAFRPSC